MDSISMMSLDIFSVYLILPAALWPFIRNEYRKCFWGVKQARRVRLAASLQCVSRLSRKCGLLDVLQPYRPTQPVMGIVLYLLYENITKLEQIHLWANMSYSFSSF
jgi:hypothetical protein